MDALDLHFLNALAHLREGRVEDAVRELTLLQGRQPENGKAKWLEAKILHENLRDYARAEELYKQAMRLEPTFDLLHLSYASLLIDLSRFAEAIAVLNKAAEIPGVEKDKVDRLFGLLNERQEKFDDALQHFNKAMLYTFSNEQMDVLQKDIERVMRKKGLSF